MFGLGKNKKLEGTIKAFCQSCGNDLTDEGGDVSSSKRIYCHGYKDDGESRCLDFEMSMMAQGMIPMGVASFNYHDAKTVQKDIRKKRLDHYGPLEKT